MMDVRSKRSLSLAYCGAATIAFGFFGCGGGGDGTQVQVAPEALKKTEDFLKNYQKSMYDQHKPKGKSSSKKAK